MRKKCFVICPFGAEVSDKRDRSNLVFEHIIKPIAVEEGYDAYRTIDKSKPGEITSRLIEDLYEADLVIADLTDLNPNVMYELALRHATGKPFIHLSESLNTIPFDIGPMNVIALKMTDLPGADETKNELRGQIQAIKRGESNFGNPASRYGLTIAEAEYSKADYSSKIYSWEIQYTSNFAQQWLERKGLELQQCVQLFNMDETKTPVKSGLRNGLAEYLEYKLMQGAILIGTLSYIVDNKTHDIYGANSWANFSMPDSGSTLSIQINGNEHDGRVRIIFHQPSRPVHVGTLNENIRSFNYTIDFELEDPNSKILKGELYHPEYPKSSEGSLVLATTKLIPRFGLA